MHPRKLGRAWLRSGVAAPRDAREAPAPPSPAAIPLPFDRQERSAKPSRHDHVGPPRTGARADREPHTELVPTSEETRRQLGLSTHTLSREETAAWNAEDDAVRADARRAIREAVREQGGGELRDHRGRVLERIAIA